MNKLKSLWQIERELLKKRFDEIPKNENHEWKRITSKDIYKGQIMKKDEIVQIAQEKVEETIEKVKEVLDKKETKDMLKGAAVGALLGGVAMFWKRDI